jgi:hypothetical protein
MGCTNTVRNAGASPAGSGSALAWPWSGTGGAESRNVGVDAVRPQIKTRMANTAARILQRAGRPSGSTSIAAAAVISMRSGRVGVAALASVVVAAVMFLLP